VREQQTILKRGEDPSLSYVGKKPSVPSQPTELQHPNVQGAERPTRGTNALQRTPSAINAIVVAILVNFASVRRWQLSQRNLLQTSNLRPQRNLPTPIS